MDKVVEEVRQRRKKSPKYRPDKIRKHSRDTKQSLSVTPNKTPTTSPEITPKLQYRDVKSAKRSPSISPERSTLGVRQSRSVTRSPVPSSRRSPIPLPAANYSDNLLQVAPIVTSTSAAPIIATRQFAEDRRSPSPNPVQSLNVSTYPYNGSEDFPPVEEPVKTTALPLPQFGDEIKIINDENAKAIEINPWASLLYKVDFLNRYSYPINMSAGILVMLVLAYKITHYLESLHENELWFSNIKELERELSLRREQGLYYYYYKHLINAPSFFSGLLSLMSDSMTESGRIINVLARFNIYQEIFLSAAYRFLDLKGYVQPVIFYVKTIFLLHAVYMCAIFTTTWILSHSWLASSLALCLYAINRVDATRVNSVIPLRENFCLPFLFWEICILSYYLQPRLTPKEEKFTLLIIGLLTCVYCTTWQFAPYLIFLQSGILFILAMSTIISKVKVIKILITYGICLIVVGIIQFGQALVFGSLALSFLPSAVFILTIQSRCPSMGVKANVVRVSFRLLFAVGFTLTLNLIVKTVLNMESDSHIWKLMFAKLGVESRPDFESQLYSCNEAFQPLDSACHKRLSRALFFPLYIILEFIYINSLVIIVILKWRNSAIKKEVSRDRLLHKRPELAFHVVLSAVLAILAMSTSRMRFLWVPHMCIVTAVGISDFRLWRTLFGMFTTQINCIRHVACGIVIIYLLYKFLPGIMKELEELKEFWDPDTVELMEWIQIETQPSAVFAGSMQILTGVKLCTGRAISNHPHFEDKWLRERTKRVYQIYGRQSPQFVYKIFKEIQVNYIIIEDSICLGSHNDPCRVPDIVDLHNGHVCKLNV